MAEAWIGDTFRIFPGKYGEDPLWGDARDLKFADGRHAEEAFSRKHADFREPKIPQTLPRELPDFMVQYGLKPFIKTRTIRAEKFYLRYTTMKTIPKHCPTIPPQAKGMRIQNTGPKALRVQLLRQLYAELAL